MSKPAARARYVLPEHIDAPRVCYKVPVPNDPQHIAAFLGAIRSLGSWYSWQEDPTHKASKVSAVWRKIGDHLKRQDCSLATGNLPGDIEDCMKLRIDPDNTCIIQCFDDCAQTWGTWLDISTCVPGAAGQQNPGGTPSNGQENCYDILIPGNSQWISPVPVKEGDSIVTSLVGGGWFDGSGWWCPNGQTYALGACVGSTSTSPSDPAPSIPHARLISTLDAGVSWNDAFNTNIAIPAGTAPTNLILQMNDPSLSDNGGSINLRVCITTKNPTNWEHTYDLVASDGGFTPFNPGDFDRAAYTAGSGWSCNPAHTRLIQINSPSFPVPGHVTKFTFRFNGAIPGTTTWDIEYNTQGGTSFDASPTPGNPYIMVGDATMTSFWSNLDAGVGSWSGIFLYQITVSGVGPDPYA